MGITKEQLTNIARAIALSDDETVNIKILERGVFTSNINLLLDDSIIVAPDEITIENSYYDSATDKYIVDNTSFVGSIGFKLNNTSDSLLVGVLEKYDPLKAVNTFVHSSGNAKNRIFELNNDYTVFESIGTTTAGLMILEGNNKFNEKKNEGEIKY